MESWNSEWTGDLSSQSSVEPALPSYVNENINYDSLDIESPHFSEDSKEGLSEPAKSDKNIVKPTLINTSLAKKRLQAYSKHVNKIPIKEEKGEPKEKHQDISFKKKKDYPFQKSKAVIQEIEEIKRKELAHTHRQLLMTQSIQYLHSSEHSIDGNQQFRRREIKRRNYRRTDSTNRKSISPEVHHRNKSISSPTRKYPKDWSEYNANRLTISQNDKSNSKKYSKKRSVSDLLEKLYNFQVPSSSIESFKCETENGIKEVSPFFLRLTKSKPPISYSVNWEKIKDSYITRDQLFQLVPEIRQKTIKSLITTHSKSQPLNKKIESKSWYSKTWRKHSDAECKVLENSVGLSFLQTYSDEEEEIETEEILICSSINNTKTSNANKNNSYKSKEKVDKKLDEFLVIPDNQQEEILNKNETNLTDPLDESGFLTPEIPQEFQKSVSVDVSMDNQKVISEEPTKTKNRSKEKPRKKRKSKKRAESTSKKKKKKKRKGKNETSDEESVDSNNKKKETKKLRKTKSKTEDKPVKLKTEKKQNSSKVLKPKKKNKITEEIELKKKRAKKNKKEAEHIETKSPLVDNIKKLKKQFKKTKLSYSNDINSEENKKKPDKNEKNIDLIAINKSYRPSLDTDIVKDLSHEKKVKKHHSPERKLINKSLKPEFEDFPLEKDISELAPKVKTPDTEEYRGNWEKDSFESEGENMYNKPKLNSSWESDEELYERQERPNEHSRTFTEVSNLEIPLNIKPFKKRDLEFDIKLDTEKKKLDILEKKLGIQEKKLDIEENNLDFNFESSVKKIQIFDFDIEPIPSPIPEKKRRWDKTEKESTPIRNIKPPDLNAHSLNSSTALENEYVEFMKAVTSNTNSNIASSKIDDSIIYLSNKIDDSIISLSSNESVEITSEEIVICPKDIPFIPMPDEVTLVPDVVTAEIIPEPVEIVPVLNKEMPELDEIMPELDEIKPVPVPCPTLDITPKHLINFNISGKIDSPKIIKMNLLENQENLVDSSTQSTGEDFNTFSINLETKDVEAKDTSPIKPFSFTTLVLPSKKALLDNSNLKLGDSDDDADKALKPIDEIRKELIIDTNTGENLQKEETFTINRKLEEPEEKEKIHRRSRSISPPKSSHSQEIRKPKEKDKRESSPRRNRMSRKRESSSLRRRSYSPKRGSSPKRRRKSPERYRDRRRKSSVGGRRYSSRRSPSPRRKSPRRSLSPRQSISPRSRLSTKSSIKSTSRFISNVQPPKVETQIQKSPTIASPLEGLKKSVADSTISDDSLLPQPNLEEYTQSPIPQFFNRPKPKRMSLEDRINLEMGWNKEEPQPISTTYGNFYNQNQFAQDFSSINIYPNTNMSPIVSSNLVQIVPQDMTEINTPPEFVHRNKSKILQVGNMLQIVPADLPPEIPLPPLPSPPPIEELSVIEPAAIENESIQFENDDTLSEHRADREKRKVEREARRKEKENRRREKEKQRNIKMKQKTENMIMRALQLEIENNEEVETELNDSTVQWPPLPNICASKDLLNKSILVQGQRKIHKGKNVQFADGIRPGEGTSPSAGEDLCSSPPTKVLPKEKRYTKTKLRVRNVKKKVKVKIIKPNADVLQSGDGEENEDDDDYLPPPSPPPGSPPPHIYPPRVKTIINNIHAYVSNVSQTVYSSSVNPLMATQSLPHLQQLHMGGQPQPPMADPHVQVHHLAHYQVPALTATAPPPPPPPLPMGSSAIRKRRRPNSQRYKKY